LNDRVAPIYASVKKPTIIETIRLDRLRWFGHVQRMEDNRIPKKSIIYEFGNNKIESKAKKLMTRGGERGWKNSRWRRVAGKKYMIDRKEEAPENGKESSNSAHANGMNE
jgi:hypothetical protein